MGTRSSRIVRGVAVAALAAGITACDSAEEKTARQAQPAIDSMAAARARGETDLSNPEMGAKMQVTLTEYQITQSHKDVPKGQLTMVVENKGKQPHVFEMKGETGDYKSMPIPAGGYVIMTLITEPGTYDMFCPDSAGVHRDRGMAAKLVVNPPAS